MLLVSIMFITKWCGKKWKYAIFTFSLIAHKHKKHEWILQPYYGCSNRSVCFTVLVHPKLWCVCVCVCVCDAIPKAKNKLFQHGQSLGLFGMVTSAWLCPAGWRTRP